MLKFSLQNEKVKIVNVNPRAELHGDEPKSACDIKIEATLANDDLAEFHPTLKSLLYVKDEDRPDLISQADPGHATMLRFPQLKGPHKWDGEIIGAAVTVHYGTTEKSHIVLPTCLVNEFRLEPLEGGSVVVTCRVQAHPDEKAFGKLCMLVGTEIGVSIKPPESELEHSTDARLGEE
jgi:hypothetical protein